MVVLMAACGFNWLQVQQLQGRIAELEARDLRPKHGPVTRTHTPEAGLSLIDLPTHWKYLCGRADALCIAGRKVFFHEPSI